MASQSTFGVIIFAVFLLHGISCHPCLSGKNKHNYPKLRFCTSVFNHFDSNFVSYCWSDFSQSIVKLCQQQDICFVLAQHM